MKFPKPSCHPLASIPEAQLKYAVICASYQGKWVFCRHKARETWELPGGHIEKGETALEAARRELHEETGAIRAKITPVTIYKLFDYGLLCYAEIQELSSIPEFSEIKEIQFCESVPENLTYGGVHDLLLQEVQRWIAAHSTAAQV